MSIYSGFATRSLEQYYDKMLYNLISTLLLRLTKFYRRQKVDEQTFLRIVFDQEKSLKKIQKRKYLEPKYSQLLTAFKRQLSTDEPQEIEMHRTQLKTQRSRAKDTHELNRSLSLLGKQFGELRANAEKIDRFEGQSYQEESISNLAKIEQHKKHVSKRKKNQKKISVKSNLDIWDVRHQKPPELPSLHPLQGTLTNKTKFKDLAERQQSKEIQEPSYDQDQSLRYVISKQPKFRAKMYFK